MTQFEYPPSDPNSFHHTTYDTTGYFMGEDQYCLPLGSQHQQNLVSDPSSYLRGDGSFDHYGTVTQHPIHPIPPSSGSSELGNALVEISSAEPQPTSRTSIALPSLPLPSQPATKHEPCEGTIGLNPVKTEYGVTAFSPMTPLDSTGDHSPYIKEEDDEQSHVGTPSMRRASTPLHGHGSLCHRHSHEPFRVVEDPTAYPGFASSTKVRSCLTIAYTCSSTYRGTRHRAYLFQALSHIPLACVSTRRSRRRSRLPIQERLHRA